MNIIIAKIVGENDTNTVWPSEIEIAEDGSVTCRYEDTSDEPQYPSLDDAATAHQTSWALCSYATDSEPQGRYGLSAEQAQEIAREDASLLYVATCWTETVGGVELEYAAQRVGGVDCGTLTDASADRAEAAGLDLEVDAYGCTVAVPPITRHAAHVEEIRPGVAGLYLGPADPEGEGPEGYALRRGSEIQYTAEDIETNAWSTYEVDPTTGAYVLESEVAS